MIRGAALSDDGAYRYALTGRWEQGPSLLWVMLNPSTADADVDDPTIRRVVGFSRRWGFAAADVVNLFALRATDPSELARSMDPIGPDNDRSIWTAALRAGGVVAAWGERGRLLGRDAAVLELLASAGCGSVSCLGRTRAGAPRHPLRLHSDTARQLFWTPEEQQSLEGTEELADVVPLRPRRG